ncbi:hypothetical protein DPMN_043481 [Dreissena polymorpha]|uniref:Uncharacterized protein n=1 Tax=Dreissena polymorpha TaxID=45954 RepID=A0A9D4D1G6_DREPO|nr:hypothetical protein DPMN_043481 [Dreissena polymorpha]
MLITGLARHSPQLVFGTCRMCMSELHDIRPSSIFRTIAECRCKSWLDIRSSSIFGTCRMPMSELPRHSPQLDIQD